MDKKKIWMTAVPMMLCAGVIFYFLGRTPDEDSMKRISDVSKSVSYDRVGQRIFIKSHIKRNQVTPGLIYISSEDRQAPDSEKDVVINEPEIYYRWQGTDSLMVYYASDNPDKAETLSIGKVNVVLNGFHREIEDKYITFYKEFDLYRFSADRGLE